MCLWLNFSIRVHVRSIREGVEKWCWQIVEDPRRPSSRSLTRPSFGYYYSTLRRDLCVDSRVFTPKKVYIWKKKRGAISGGRFLWHGGFTGGQFLPPSLYCKPVPRCKSTTKMNNAMATYGEHEAYLFARYTRIVRLSANTKWSRKKSKKKKNARGR